MKTYILFVSGVDSMYDHAAQDFNESYSYIQDRIAKTMLINGIDAATLQDDNGYQFELILHKFRSIDPDFITFIRHEIQGEDGARDRDFIFWTKEEMNPIIPLTQSDLETEENPHLKEFIQKCLDLEH